MRKNKKRERSIEKFLLDSLQKLYKFSPIRVTICVFSRSRFSFLSISSFLNESLSLSLYTYTKRIKRARIHFLSPWWDAATATKQRTMKNFKPSLLFFQKRNETKLRLWKNSSHDHFNILLTYIQRERVRFFRYINEIVSMMMSY